MRVQKLKPLSIAICCFAIALCLETKSMDSQGILKGEILYKTNMMLTLERYMDMEALKTQEQEIDKQKSLGNFVVFPLDVLIIILSNLIEINDNNKFDKSLFLNPCFLELMKNVIARNSHIFFLILEAANERPVPSYFPDLKELIPPNYIEIMSAFIEIMEPSNQNPLNFLGSIIYDPPLIAIDGIIGVTAYCYRLLRPGVEINPILTSQSPVKAFVKSAYTSLLPEVVQETLWKGYQAFSGKNPRETYELKTYEIFSWEGNDKVKVEKCDDDICNTEKKSNCNEWILALSIPSLLKLSANEDVFAFLISALEHIEENPKEMIYNENIHPERNFMEFWYDVNQERVGSNYQALHDKKDLYRHADIYRAYYWKEYVFQEGVPHHSHHISDNEQHLIVYAFSQKSFDQAKKETKILKSSEFG